MNPFSPPYQQLLSSLTSLDLVCLLYSAEARPLSCSRAPVKPPQVPRSLPAPCRLSLGHSCWHVAPAAWRECPGVGQRERFAFSP